jgi:hypothetical protein
MPMPGQGGGSSKTLGRNRFRNVITDHFYFPNFYLRIIIQFTPELKAEWIFLQNYRQYEI